MLNVGILNLQGSVIEHTRALKCTNRAIPKNVQNKNDIEGISGLIIPGGESTTIGKLLDYYDMKNMLIEKILDGLPVWGTCAGMILLAEKICDDSVKHLGVMNIAVRRNAYGSQLDSFKTTAIVPGISNTPIPLVFIRAPWIESVSNTAKSLLCIDNKIVVAKQDNMLATSFHPELTDNTSFHNYFVDMCLEYSSKKPI